MTSDTPEPTTTEAGRIRNLIDQFAAGYHTADEMPGLVLGTLDAARLSHDRGADAEKLRVLATWFDHFDDWREATGKIAPGITDYREVQDDLRRIAAALSVPAPTLPMCTFPGCSCAGTLPAIPTDPS